MSTGSVAPTSTINPPVIRGEVPADYHGPLYYRIFTFGWSGAKKSLVEQLMFANPPMAQRLARVDWYYAAQHKAPELCDPNGDLLSNLHGPLKAKLKAGAKAWDEFSIGTAIYVSPRIRDIIEAAAPGVHYFIPIDVDDRAGGTFRVYAFYAGLTRKVPAVALEANGIGYTMSDTGEPLFRYPDWLTTTDRFAWLNASVIDGAPLLFDWKLSLLLSDALVERMGGCLAKGKAFVPMGLV